jgi:hypothetical protein
MPTRYPPQQKEKLFARSSYLHQPDSPTSRQANGVVVNSWFVKNIGMAIYDDDARQTPSMMKGITTTSFTRPLSPIGCIKTH